MAETQAPATDAEIREGIANTIRAGLRKIYPPEIANAVVIHAHWLFGFSLGDAASLLMVDSGPEEGKVHGWIIGLNSITRTRPDPARNGSGATDLQGHNRLRKTGINRRDILRSYSVWCYHQLDTGIDGTETTDNSENRLTNEIEAVADEFSRTPTLGIDNPNLVGHEEIQYSPIGVFRFDDIQANVAEGTLGVRTQRPLDLTQY